MPPRVGFIFHASSFILPQTCSMMFMSGDWAGQSWSTLIFFTLRNFDVEMEVCDGAPSCCKIWPLLWLECKRQLRLLDILDYWCCLPPCRSLAHPHTPIFWVNLGSMRAPVGLLQYLRRLWCYSTEDSSEKSTFCHFSSVHPFGRLFNCHLFSAGFWALIRPWRPFRDRIRQTVLVDTGTSGDQVSWSSAAVEKGLALDFGANKLSSRAVVLRGLPDLGLSKMSPVSSYIFLILCTWRWDTLKVSATSAVDLVFSLLIISTLVSGWILGMLSKVKLQLMWRSGVLGFFLYTLNNWLINYWSQVKL